VTPDPATQPSRPARIVESIEEAADLTRRGTNVVLVVSPDAEDPEAGVYPTGGPGRLALMVGRIDDPAVRAAAREMAGELF
jgi:hypothetical protein